MPQDISGFGLRIRLTASKTFPSGVDLTQFADDSDPLDFPSVQIADTAMGLNGDLITWSKANPLKVTLAVIPGSEDDRNLAALWDANRAGKGKTSAQDVITVTGVYPDGKTKTLSNGRLTDGAPGISVASGGRKKTVPYSFAFESVSGT